MVITKQKQIENIETYKKLYEEQHKLTKECSKGWGKALWEWRRSIDISFILWLIMFISGILFGINIGINLK